MSTDDLTARARDVAGEMLIEARPDVAPLLTELADRIENDALTLAEDERTMRRLADAIDRLETRTREDQMRADIWRDREDRYEQTIKGLEIELHEAKTERDAARGELARTEEQIHERGGFVDRLVDLEFDQPATQVATEESAKALISEGVAALVKARNPTQEGTYVNGWIVAAEWTSVELEQGNRGGIETVCPAGQMLSVSRGLGAYIGDRYQVVNWGNESRETP